MVTGSSQAARRAVAQLKAEPSQYVGQAHSTTHRRQTSKPRDVLKGSNVTPSDHKALHTITYGQKIYNYFDFIGETA